MVNHDPVRNQKWRLVILRHFEEVTNNVSKTCRYYVLSLESSSFSGLTHPSLFCAQTSKLKSKWLPLKSKDSSYHSDIRSNMSVAFTVPKTE